MKHPEILIFDIRTMDEERADQFNSFFYVWDLMKLFADEHRTTQIVVGDNDVRAVTNTHGGYRKDLITFHDFLQIASDNLRFEEAIFMIIEKPRTFMQFMINIRKINQFFQNELNVEDIDNIWNIVYYNESLKF